MKTKEEISKILDEILDKVIYYNENIATMSFNVANRIIIPNDLYFEFTDKSFINRYLTFTGEFPMSIINGILYIFSMKCYRTSKQKEISVEYK